MPQRAFHAPRMSLTSSDVETVFTVGSTQRPSDAQQQFLSFITAPRVTIIIYFEYMSGIGKSQYESNFILRYLHPFWRLENRIVVDKLNDFVLYNGGIEKFKETEIFSMLAFG